MFKERIKPIKSEEDYDWALDEIESYFDAPLGSDEADYRDVLAILVEKYEDENYPMDLPAPIEAIKFRMDQMDLKQKDMIPYLGNVSKVSEILSGKRELTMKMARAIHQGLGISAEILLQEMPVKSFDELNEYDFEKFPIKDMENNGAFRWFPLTDIKDKAEEAIALMIQNLGGMDALPCGLYRKTSSPRVSAKTDQYALLGWELQVLLEDRMNPVDQSFSPGRLTDKVFSQLIGLSRLKEGPLLAKEFLKEYGINVLIIPHLKKTYLDGASFMTREGKGIIGMSLRYDRIDNFWFTLCHELGHLMKHLSPDDFIIDDMTMRGSESDTDVEREADNFAESILFPEGFKERAWGLWTPQDVKDEADRQGCHTALVAGHIRHESGNWRRFRNLVGQDEVRKLFDITAS